MASTPLSHAKEHRTTRSSPWPSTPVTSRGGGSRRQRAKGRQQWKAFEYADHGAFASQFEALGRDWEQQHHDRPDSSSSHVLSPDRSSRSTHTDDTHDFQVFTARKHKRAGNTQPEVDSCQRLPADLADMRKSIHEVFGNELPFETFIKANPGIRDGQVQFVRHTNGDVAAHQWIRNAYEWTEIGSHRYATSTIEGPVSHDDLKLPATWDKQDIGSLAYFRLLGKQREARSIREDFCDKHIKALLPGFRPTASPLQHAAVPMTGQSATKAASSTDDEQVSSNIISSAYRFNEQHTPAPRHTTSNSYMSGASSITTTGHGESFYTPILGSAYSTKYDCSIPRFTAVPTLQQYYNLYDLSPWQMSLSTYAGTSMPQHMQHIQQVYSSGDPQYSMANPAHQSPSNGYQNSPLPSSVTIPPRRLNHEQTTPLQPLSAVTPQTRSLMRTAVMRMSEQAKERTKSQADDTAVLYAHTPSPLSAGHTATPSIYHSAKTSSSAQYTPSTLHDSSPDRAWQSRPAVTLRSVNSSIVPPLTPQNFDGPFFPAEADHARAFSSRLRTDAKTHDERVNDWWWSGNNFLRQEDFYNRHRATQQQSKVEGLTTKASSSHSHNDNPLPDGSISRNSFDLGRLMVPVHENLMAYHDEPAGKMRDCFCRWSKAPEWAIDRSATGNSSFFETDWNPPARVGRDARFYSNPRELRFGRLESIRFRQSTPDHYMFGRRYLGRSVESKYMGQSIWAAELGLSVES